MDTFQLSNSQQIIMISVVCLDKCYDLLKFAPQKRKRIWQEYAKYVEKDR